jgi:hypothetical protein
MPVAWPRVAMIWPCDDNANLIGEQVHVDLSSARIEKGKTVEIVTAEQAAEMATPLHRGG